MLGRIKPLLAPVVIAATALALAWIYAGTTLRRTDMGLPLDAGYLALHGGVHEASALWPLVVAPLHAAGARQGLVWFAFVLCALCYAAAAVGAWDVVRRLATEACGILAATGVLALPALTWSVLAGTEAALCGALLVLLVRALVTSERGPRGHVLVLLAATALARPELAVIVSIACVIGAARAFARTHPREATAWLAPLAAPLAWLAWIASHGHPAWPQLLVRTPSSVRALAWETTRAIPIVVVVVLAGLWLVGAVRVVAWARSAARMSRVPSRWLAAVVMLGSPIVFAICAVITAGTGALHVRHLAPVLPLIALPVAVALAPRARWAWSSRASLVLVGGAIIGAVVYAVPRERRWAIAYAQGVADTNAHSVKLARYLQDRVPTAVVLAVEPGAFAFYGATVVPASRAVVDGGQGVVFEWLERVAHDPSAARPTHVAYYASWSGIGELVDPMLTDGFLGPAYASETTIRPEKQMVLAAVNWDHIATGEQPLTARDGMTMIDRVDIADVASERAHGWSSHDAVGSFVAREASQHGLVIDGGRTIGARHPGESFTIARTPGKLAKLVMRSGGAPNLPGEERIRAPVELRIVVDGAAVGTRAVAAPSGSFVEVEIALPPAGGSTSHIEVTATSTYRSFHYFILEPT